MTTNQEARQASVRAATGTTLDYNGDWSALFDQAAIPAGAFNGRQLAWINQVLGTSYPDLPGAMQAFAANQGVYNWSSMGTISLSAYSPEALALFAAMNVQPSSARKALINTCIGGLKSAGWWVKLDWLCVLAAHDQQASILNWIAPAGPWNLTGGVTPSWAADRGFTGDGATTYLGGSYTPGFAGAQAVRDSNHFGSWNLTGVAVSAVADAGNPMFSISGHQSTGILCRNSSSAAAAVTDLTGSNVGGVVANRTGSAGYDVYKSGAFQGNVAQASLALTNFGVWVCARNNSGVAANFSIHQVAVVHGGAALTPTEISAGTTVLQTFLTALGN